VFLADDMGVGKTMTVIAFWAAKVANYLDWREVQRSQSSLDENIRARHLAADREAG